MGDPVKKSRDSGYFEAIRTAGPLFGSGIQLAASAVVMFFLGRWLDTLFGTKPWLMLLSIFFGLVAGMVNFLKIVSRIEKNKTKGK